MAKNKINNGLFIIAPLLVYGGYKAFEIYDFTKKVTIELKNINIKGKESKDSNYSKLVFDLQLILKNPTTYEGEIKKIDINVYGNNKFLANVTSNKSFKILPYKAITLHNDVTISTDKSGDIVQAILSAIDTKKFTLKYIGKLYTTLGSFKININQEV